MLKLASHAATVKVFSSSEVYIAAAPSSAVSASDDESELELPQPTIADIASTLTSNNDTIFFFIKLNPPYCSLSLAQPYEKIVRRIFDYLCAKTALFFANSTIWKL
jgi:hypothetical protein